MDLNDNSARSSASDGTPPVYEIMTSVYKGATVIGSPCLSNVYRTLTFELLQLAKKADVGSRFNIDQPVECGL